MFDFWSLIIGYKKSIIDGFLGMARKIPYVERQIEKELEKAKKSLDEDVDKNRNSKTYKIPEKSMSDQDIEKKLLGW